MDNLFNIQLFCQPLYDVVIKAFFAAYEPYLIPHEIFNLNCKFVFYLLTFHNTQGQVEGKSKQTTENEASAAAFRWGITGLI